MSRDIEACHAFGYDELCDRKKGIYSQMSDIEIWAMAFRPQPKEITMSDLGEVVCSVCGRTIEPGAECYDHEDTEHPMCCECAS